MAISNEATSSSLPADYGVESRLRRLWIRYTARCLLRGGAWLTATAGGLILADLLLDWQLDLAGGLRLALLASNLVLLAIVARRALLRRLRTYDAVEQALEVERAWPELSGLVVSGVQFADVEKASPGVSRELMQAVCRLASQRTAGLRVERLASKIAIRAAAGAMLVAVLAMAVVAAWKPEFLRAFGLRMTHPLGDVAYPTRTTIELIEVPSVVRAGESLTLAARAGGEVPEGGRIFLRIQGAGWEAAEVTANQEAEFRYALRRTNDDFEYYFRLGDARSARRAVKVVRPPRVVEGRVDLAYPEYTKLKNQTVDVLNLKVPEGTLLRWHVRFDRPVESADLAREGLGPQSMTLSSDGREAELQLPADASRPYTIDFGWRLADRRCIERGVKHYIQVVPDADPQAGLLRPAEDAKATLKKTIGLAYWARDDYGLAQASIAFAINDMAELRRPLGSLKGEASVERECSWPITRLLPTLKLNDIATFAVEVSDGRPGMPGRGRSVARRVQFVSDGEYIAYALARHRKLLGQLRPLYLQEREAAARLEAIEKSSSRLAQQVALEVARQDLVATQLGEVVTRFDDLIADLASNGNVATDVSNIASSLRTRLATIHDVRLVPARKWMGDAVRRPAEAGGRLADARMQIELAAREMGSLLIHAGVSQACDVFAAELREIAARQEALQGAVTEPAGAAAAADAQKALAERIDKLVQDVRTMRESPADALAAVRLARARKIIDASRVSAEMRKAAQLLSSRTSATQQQMHALKTMHEALLRLRPDARLEELVRARNALSESLDAQKILRAQVARLTPDELGQQKEALKFRQEAILRPALQVAGALEIDGSLTALDRAGAEAAAALGAADGQSAAALDRVESCIASALATLAEQVAKWNALGETHKRMLEAAQRLRLLSEIRDRAEQIRNAAFDAAGAGKALTASAAAQQQLAKDIGVLADALPASSIFAVAMRRPLRKTSRATAKAAVVMQAGNLDAVMPELLKAEQSLKEASDIGKRELAVLEKLWLFQQASADLKQIALTIGDIESEQTDLRTESEATQREGRAAANLAGQQAVLARAAAQVQDSVAAIGEAAAMKDPLDAAAAAMNQAAGQLEKNQAVAAIQLQAKAAAALQDARKTGARLVGQIDLMVVEITAASELNSRAMDLLQRQIELREATEEAEGTAIAPLAADQDILLAETTVMAGMSMAPKAAGAFQTAADEMAAALKELKASARQPAVEHQKKAEDALLAGIVAMEEFIRSMVSMTEQPGKFINAFDGMTAVLLLATEQRELREVVQRSTPAALAGHVEKQTELHGRCVEAAKMPNIVEPTGRIAGWEHIEAAAKAMDEAVGALKSSVKPKAIEHQQLAERELRIAFAMNVVEMINAMKPPPPIPLPELPPPPVEPPAAMSVEHWVEFAKASPTGKAMQGGKAEWNSLKDRQRAALNENFARELPLEFRKLLKDYYEALAK